MSVTMARALPQKALIRSGEGPATRMTIDEALKHDVFAKPVLLRNLNPGGAYGDILNTDNVQIEQGQLIKN